MVDGLEFWVELDAALVNASLRSLLSCLSIFERPGFAFKNFLPLAVKPAIELSTGVLRRRLDQHVLHWRDDQLAELVEKRLALAGGTPFQWDQVRARWDVMQWLAAVGQKNPREWLDLTRQLLLYWRDQERQSTLSDGDWEALMRSTQVAKQNIPLLYIDEQSGQVYRGVEELHVAGQSYELLLYLYKNRNQICKREELYYRVMSGLGSVPAKGDKGWEEKLKWKNNLDNAIARLRQKVEIDTSHPIYITSRRGKGYVLQNARWMQFKA